MIVVTENAYLEGTGNISKDVEYKSANDHHVHLGDIAGDLSIYRVSKPLVKDLTPASINVIEEPVYELLAYYRAGSYVKFTYKP